MRRGLGFLAALATLSGAQAPGVDSAARTPDAVARVRAEQEAPRKLVPFDPAHFDKYVGYYELTPNLIFKVTRDGDKFYGQLRASSPSNSFRKAKRSSLKLSSQPSSASSPMALARSQVWFCTRMDRNSPPGGSAKTPRRQLKRLSPRASGTTRPVPAQKPPSANGFWL